MVLCCSGKKISPKFVKAMSDAEKAICFSMKSNLESLTDEQYSELLEAAEAARKDGRNDRESADMYREAILKAPSKWEEKRWSSLLIYADLLKKFVTAGEGIGSDDQDMLESMARNVVEPTLFRIQAEFIFGTLYMINDQFDFAASTFRSLLFEKIFVAGQNERSRRIVVNVAGMEMSVSVGEQLDGLVTILKQYLDILESPEYVDVEGIPFINGKPDPDIVRRLTVGGDKCDCCGKKRTDTLFLCCNRCRRSYFCSDKCFWKQLEAGHKACCRERDQIEPGDLMTIRRSKPSATMPDLTSNLVRVIGPDSQSEQEGKWWIITILASGQRGTIHQDMLRHIRPEK